jgi:DNA modification methylase
LGDDPARGLHPTQKPVALFEYLIKTYTQPGELVFDPCVGSGTTALAAKNTDRQYICGDFTAEYVELARNRLGEILTFPDYVETKNGDKQLTLFGGTTP